MATRKRGVRASPRRHSADERRELVLEAARREFAALGLGGATGEGLSYRAGISHPYLLRLFGSKRELFLEVLNRLFDDLVAAARAETGLREALGEEGASLLLQCFAACGVDEVRLAVQRRMGELHEAVERSGSEPEEVFAGLLLNGAVEAMRLDALASREPWARQLLDSGESS
ncbi:MAG TPA: TetR/AcrR family transcriptional regulator [Thermoleophilaceae bacterium]|nr:TetR/AcrR family transcriptional regulator [Thermoleophilaceae bacterium]